MKIKNKLQSIKIYKNKCSLHSCNVQIQFYGAKGKTTSINKKESLGCTS